MGKEQFCQKADVSLVPDYDEHDDAFQRVSSDPTDASQDVSWSLGQPHCDIGQNYLPFFVGMIIDVKIFATVKIF